VRLHGLDVDTHHRLYDVQRSYPDARDSVGVQHEAARGLLPVEGVGLAAAALRPAPPRLVASPATEGDHRCGGT